MGMLQGKIVQDTFIVIDVFALPVEGTETRVNAQAEAYEYMVDFADSNKVSIRNLMPSANAELWARETFNKEGKLDRGSPCTLGIEGQGGTNIITEGQEEVAVEQASIKELALSGVALGCQVCSRDIQYLPIESCYPRVCSYTRVL
eukprot:1159433-Pelagomonas_calceolata.AAC.3